jgi:hypothetical protein
LQKKQHFHTTISLKRITMALFFYVWAKNGVSRQLNVNKSHDIQFPWAVMPSEPFSSGFSQDFRTKISCFVPILHKIPVEWTNQNHKKKATKTTTMTHCR